MANQLIYERHVGLDPMSIAYSYNLGGPAPEVFAPYDTGPMMGLDIPKLLFAPLKALGETETQMETLGLAADPTEYVNPTGAAMGLGIVIAFMAAGAIVNGVHAKKKYGDIGSILAWGAAGAAFPLPTTLLSLATGYGKR